MKPSVSRRKRLFEIIEAASEEDRASNVYDVLMMLTILVSLVPLAFKTEYPAFVTIETVAVIIFSVDYILRIATADFKLGKGKTSFLPRLFQQQEIVALAGSSAQGELGEDFTDSFRRTCQASQPVQMA